MMARKNHMVARYLATALLTALGAARVPAQTAPQRTYANPIDIDYKNNF